MLRPSSFRLLRSLLVLFILAQPLAALAARTVLIFGDSLSAGYGIRQEDAWPSLLAKRLQERHPDYNVVNASISGETSSGGRSRLPAALERHNPSVVVIALGSNDGLRGLPIATLRENLLAMIDAAQKTKARVLLVGQRLPPNYGRYAEEFAQTFADIARQRRLASVDFLLEGIATRRDLFQADALHPTAEAQPILMESVWKRLEPLLK
ncbi:arylesterase [uncultured Propionivibrio sp.]|uniref:arylesterase n=1 Tax=uncultured Propionivibrio sp. TaxID=426737 RepID=UPI0029BFE5A9|nr:arylesterase [uncultured Propionivibrio sp.]